MGSRIGHYGNATRWCPCVLSLNSSDFIRILVILSIQSVIASTLSPLLAANTVTLSLLFDKDFTQMALATGYHLLGVGVAGFLFVASARVWGKRHLYLLGTILIIVSSAWGGATGTNYKSLLWARIIQGVGLAPFEALVNASVGDLYFIHVCSKLVTEYIDGRPTEFHRNEGNEWPSLISLCLVEHSLPQFL